MATYSTNYKLDKYAGTDKPNLRDQYNSAIDKIDAQMKTNANAAATAATAASNASAKVDNIESELAQSISDTADSITTGYKNAIATETTRAKAAEKDLNDIATEHETLIKNNTSAIAGKAAINHASSGKTYGVASSTQYGHVKTTDKPSSSDPADIVPTTKGVKSIITELFTMGYRGAISNSSGEQVKVMTNAAGTMFKVYGLLSNINGLTVSAFNDGSGVKYGYKIDIGGVLGSNPYYIDPAGFGKYGSGATTPYGSAFAVGNDGNVYLRPANTAAELSQPAALFYMPCVYFNSDFGDKLNQTE